MAELFQILLLATNSSPARVVRRILCSFARSQSFVSHDDRLRFNKSDHLLLNLNLSLHHFVEEWHSSCLGGRFTISQQGSASKRAKSPSAWKCRKNTASKACTGEDGARLAHALGGEAAYIPDLGRPGIIAFGPNASRTAVIEELLHFGQHRKLGFGAIDDLIGLEISAQHKLLETGRRLGWTPEEMSRIERALEYWRKQQ